MRRTHPHLCILLAARPAHADVLLLLLSVLLPPALVPWPIGCRCCADAQAMPYIGDPSKNSLMTNIPMYDAAGNELGKNWCVRNGCLLCMCVLLLPLHSFFS